MRDVVVDLPLGHVGSPLQREELADVARLGRQDRDLVEQRRVRMQHAVGDQQAHGIEVGGERLARLP